MFLSFIAFVLVVGPAGGIAQGCEGGEKKRAFEFAIAASGGVFAFDGGAGAVGDRGDAGFEAVAGFSRESIAAAAQQAADAIERVAGAAAVSGGVVLDATATSSRHLKPSVTTWKGSSTRVAAGGWAASAVAYPRMGSCDAVPIRARQFGCRAANQSAKTVPEQPWAMSSSRAGRPGVSSVIPVANQVGCWAVARRTRSR